MKQIIESRENYDKLFESGSLKIDREPKTRPRKGCGKVKTDHGSNFRHGCGIQAGDTYKIKWEDDSRPERIRHRGGIVVAALTVAYSEDKEVWEVTFVRRVETVPTVLLARAAGYIQNPEHSIDPEAPAFYDSHVERIMADTKPNLRPAPEEPKLTAEEIEAEERAVAEKADRLDALGSAIIEELGDIAA